MPYDGPDFYRPLPGDPPELRAELARQAAATQHLMPSGLTPKLPGGHIVSNQAHHPGHNLWAHSARDGASPDRPAPVVPLHPGNRTDHPHQDGDGGEPSPMPQTLSAADLVGMDFPEPVWAVPGLVCEGVNLLVGAPKVGKSWLSLGLGVAVAAGRPALGKIDPTPGPVLYLALEDTNRRLKSRLLKVLDGAPAPAGLALATHLPTIPQGGAEYIASWLEAHPSARLVIIDVFAKFRGSPPSGLSAYEADYRSVSAVKKLADHYAVAVVLVHHTRKMVGEDFLQDVSGTNGLAGAADATLVLKRSRGTADAVLHVTGRDVDESEHAMAFDGHTGTWALLDGPAVDHTVTDTRAAILAHLRTHGSATPKALADALDIKPVTIKVNLKRMAEASPPQVVNNGRGVYSAPENTPLGSAQDPPLLST